MLTDPLVIQRWSIAIALACLLWAGVYILFNDAVMHAMGDGAHAAVFGSLVVGLSAVWVAFIFRRHAATRRKLLTDAGSLARWRVTREEWAAFVGKTAPETESNRKVILGLIVFFALVIPAGMAVLIGKDYKIFAWISLGIMLIGIFGHWLGGRVEQKHFIYRGGEVAFNDDGILVNGVFHGWGNTGSHLTEADIRVGEPCSLKLTYWFWTRSGGQYVDVFAPVPRAALAEVRTGLSRLKLTQRT